MKWVKIRHLWCLCTIAGEGRAVDGKVCCLPRELQYQYERGKISCRRLEWEGGAVSSRVALLLRSAEAQPYLPRFVWIFQTFSPFFYMCGVLDLHCVHVWHLVVFRNLPVGLDAFSTVPLRETWRLFFDFWNSKTCDFENWESATLENRRVRLWKIRGVRLWKIEEWDFEKGKRKTWKSLWEFSALRDFENYCLWETWEVLGKRKEKKNYFEGVRLACLRDGKLFWRQRHLEIFWAWDFENFRCLKWEVFNCCLSLQKFPTSRMCPSMLESWRRFRLWDFFCWFMLRYWTAQWSAGYWMKNNVGCIRCDTLFRFCRPRRPRFFVNNILLTVLARI